ncbi:MAG: ferric reductase-like transmembrane domain-containing protein [Pseudomonadota bacterium]
MSPLLAWRQPIYIASGFAGVVAMALLFVQPLLAGGLLPGVPMRIGRRAHLWLGGALICAILLHVGGLWITSPPDVVDALTFTSPTPFSVWGVIAMWTAFGAALLAAFRHRLRLNPKRWRLAHAALAAVTLAGCAVHALLIEGTMETVSKIALSVLAIAAFVKVAVDRRLWSIGSKRRRAIRS